MKKLALLFVASVMATVAFSQVVTIKVTQTQPFVRYEQTTAKAVLANPEWTGYKEPVNCKYVMDLDNQTSNFYEGGVFVSVLKFKSITIIGDDVRITLLDNNLEFPEMQFKTEFNYNIQKGTSSYTWYNEYGDYTRTQLNTQCVITSTK
jgi:hypothetical protein